MSPAPRLRRAVSALISCEAAFVAQMARGVQRYAQPLRHAHNVVTREQHSILFTNIEKVTDSALHMVYSFRDAAVF